jgi:hypothetical protein
MNVFFAQVKTWWVTRGRRFQPEERLQIFLGFKENELTVDEVCAYAYSARDAAMMEIARKAFEKGVNKADIDLCLGNRQEDMGTWRFQFMPSP